MKTLTHKISGVALFGVCWAADLPPELCVGVIFGATAPDFLEFPTWNNEVRTSWIDHRTVTHSPLLWFLLMLLPFFISVKFAFFSLFLAGFAASAFMHVAMDSTTPMGVPLFINFWKRQRLSAAVAITLTMIVLIILKKLVENYQAQNYSLIKFF